MKLKAIVVGLLSVGILLTGCGQKNTATNATVNKNVLIVGTEGTYAPFTFQDDKGTLRGYDIEVIKEIGKRANLEVKFVPTPWDSMFLGLESKKYDMVANQIGKNPEREKKYIFSNDYLISGAQLIVREDRNDIASLEDLKGKKVGTGTGSNYNKLLVDFDKDKKIDLKYYDGNFTSVLEDIVTGRIDATLNDRLTVGYTVKNQGTKVKLVGEPVELAPSYFVFRPDSAELQKKVDAALDSMKKDGTLAEISKKWFGEDFTK